MIRIVLLVSLLASALFSQILGGITQFPPQLKQYLELTDAQAGSIIRLNSSFQTFQFEKGRRMAQVQLELAEETAKAAIDPMALGVRHLELEAIRRALQAEQDRIAAAIQNVLTPAQKTKVQALQQAVQLQFVACEAQSVNLLGQIPSIQINANPFYGTVIPATRWFDTSAFRLPAVACGTGLRTGSFSNAIPPPPITRP
jgi:hypothetical protein